MKLVGWLRNEWRLFLAYMERWGCYRVCPDCDGFCIRIARGGKQVMCGKCGGEGWVKP